MKKLISLLIIISTIIVSGCISRNTHNNVSVYLDGKKQLEIDDRTSSRGLITKSSAASIDATLTSTNQFQTTNGTLISVSVKDFGVKDIKTEPSPEAIKAIGEAVGKVVKEVITK